MPVKGEGMRRAWGAGLAVTLLLGCSSMREYMPPEGDFRITMPGTPAADTDAQGPLYKLMDGHGENRISYVIRRVAIPNSEASIGDERLFDGFQSGGVSVIQGRITGSRPVTSGGAAHVGREFTVEARSKVSGEPYRMIWRVFREGNTLYVLQATTAYEADLRGKAVEVLDTFALLK
jgi:hypothetical protein